MENKPELLSKYDVIKQEWKTSQNYYQGMMLKKQERKTSQNYYQSMM